MSPESAFLDAIVKWVLPIAIAGIGSVVLLKLYGPAKNWFVANTDEATRKLIEMVIAQVVRAAEQTRLKAKLEGKAWDALTWAVNEAGIRLAVYGIDIDEAGIVNIIKAELLKVVGEVPTDEDGDVTSRAFGLTPSKDDLKERLWA